MKKSFSYAIGMLLILTITSCGMLKSATKGLMNVASGAADMQLKSDLSNKAYLAKSFGEIPQDKLVAAMKKAFVESGYTVNNSTIATEEQLKDADEWGMGLVKGSVISTAMNVKELGRLYQSGKMVYEIEILSAYVWILDGKNVVWLKYEKGESIAKDTWAWDTKVRDYGAEEKPGDTATIEILSDKKYYKNMMDIISKEVAAK